MSINLYHKLFKKILSEDSFGGDGGALGSATAHGGDVGNSDWYAPGDSRVPPNVDGKKIVRRDNSVKPKKKQRKNKKIPKK